jgi:transposase-like protein
MPRQKRQSPKKSKEDQLNIVVRALANGKTQVEAAHEAGVSSRSVQRWILNPEIQLRIVALQRELEAIKNSATLNQTQQTSHTCQESEEDITLRIKILAPKALSCLETIIDNPEARSGDRIQAAKLILSEWQRTQTPLAMHELNAVEVLVKSNFLPYEHLLRLKDAVNKLTDETRDIFQHPSVVTSSVRSKALN